MGENKIELVIDAMRQMSEEERMYIVLELMKDNTISYHDITNVYVGYLEMLRQGTTDKFLELRDKIIELWCHPKNEFETRLKETMHYLKDNRCVNISEEDINCKMFK